MELQYIFIEALVTSQWEKGRKKSSLSSLSCKTGVKNNAQMVQEGQREEMVKIVQDPMEITATV